MPSMVDNAETGVHQLIRIDSCHELGQLGVTDDLPNAPVSHPWCICSCDTSSAVLLIQSLSSGSPILDTALDKCLLLPELSLG